MTDRDLLLKILEDLGPSTDFVSGLEEFDEDVWIIACEKDSTCTNILAEYFESEDRLTLTANLADSPEQWDENLLISFLGLTHRTDKPNGRVRIGWDDRGVVQQKDLFSQDFEMEKLRVTLLEFVATSQETAALMSRQLPTSEDPFSGDQLRV